MDKEFKAGYDGEFGTPEYEDAWVEYFEEIKKKAAKKQHFKIVDDNF